MVTCNEAYLMAIIYRETFQVVTVVDKYLPSATVMGKVVDSSSKSGNPDTSFHVLLDTIYIVVTQAVDIIPTMAIAGQFIMSSTLRPGFYQSLTLGGNPNVVLTVLKYAISISL